MKLGKDISTNITHILEPSKYHLLNYAFSFCGLIGKWHGIEWTKIYKFFDEELEAVNCGTCKKRAQSYILRKLKGD